MSSASAKKKPIKKGGRTGNARSNVAVPDPLGEKSKQSAVRTQEAAKAPADEKKRAVIRRGVKRKATVDTKDGKPNKVSKSGQSGKPQRRADNSHSLLESAAAVVKAAASEAREAVVSVAHAFQAEAASLLGVVSPQVSKGEVAQAASKSQTTAKSKGEGKPSKAQEKPKAKTKAPQGTQASLKTKHNGARKPQTKPSNTVAHEPGQKPGGRVAVGNKLPAFEVEDDSSTPDKSSKQKSSDITRDNGAIIFFIPKANTGGCTKQALGFNSEAPSLLKAGYRVYGMSADKPKSMANWKAKYNLEHITLLSDPSFEVLKALGVLKADNKIARSHMVIGKDGIVRDIRVGISPGDSVSEAVKYVKSNGQ